ncbi:MAG: NUDIX domain-containing protein [Bacteroidales bacterium]|jgi:8-oxo-dGTP pyrophosphatase MutT (NUDIX family)|nr:NUDIX domain-containing protein [Bacteroidales bacterium]
MKIFLNDRSILISELPPQAVSPSDMIINFESPEQLKRAYDEFERYDKWRKFFIIDPLISDRNRLFAHEAFSAMFKRVDAAGGMVKNERGEYLFIHRLGFWDLPKGKIDVKDIQDALAHPDSSQSEPGFSIPDIQQHDLQYIRHPASGIPALPVGWEYPASARLAAIREVKEETGLKSVTIIHEMLCTWHIYTRKEKRFLKRTYWFAMEADSSQPLKPQASEGIFLAKWTSPKGIHCILTHTYDSIRELILEEIF